MQEEGRGESSPRHLSLPRLGLDELHVKRDLHVFADKDSATLKSCIPRQTDVFAADLGRRRSPTRVFPHGSLIGALGPSTSTVRGLLVP
jgi:hypothetical protein